MNLKKYINFMDSEKISHLRQIIKLDKQYNYTQSEKAKRFKTSKVDR